jgi:hypothetical protein
MEALSLRFGSVAQVLAELARAEGLSCPAFRSPPALVGVSRSIRRRRDGEATVAVSLRGRPWAAVLADMVEGIVAANRLRGVAADRCRTTLWAGLGEVEEAAEAGGVDRARTVATRTAGRSEDQRSNGRKASGFAA